MQKLLHWLLASPLRAGTAAAALALTRILDILGGALAATVTLRGGAAAGVQALAVAIPLIWFAGYWSGAGNMVLYAELALWLPVIAASLVLRRTGSLALMTQSVAVLVGFLVTAWYLADTDPLARLTSFVTDQFLPFYGEVFGKVPELDAAQREALAKVMPAAASATSLLVVSIAVMLGRWMQAVGFNPGGFRKDFHQLRQGRSLTLLAVALWVSAVVTGHMLAIAFAVLASVLLAFQGLALAHGVAGIRKANPMWLWMLYGLLLFLTFQVGTLLMVIGAMDNWIDWRRHVGRSEDA
ncbi:MAG: hypothetical protein R3270_04330 [Gammaproteobacteria bacterium]|nr:hypothetical protein [Gammaproteobacteria bacterium]